MADHQATKMPTINLTDKNLELLQAVVENMKAEVRTQINWDEVAKKANMKTSKYARDQWTIVRNKLIAGDGGSKPAAGTKRKDSAPSTPTPTVAPKKTKTTKANKTASRAASEEIDDDHAKVKDEEGQDVGVDDDVFE